MTDKPVIGRPGDYRVGCILSVPVTTEVGIIDHKGIMCDQLGPDGLPTVLHNAKLFDQIIETTMTDYNLMSVGAISSEGYPGILPPAEVLKRGRSQIGLPWKPWYNCEHYVHWAHGLEVRSPQMRSGMKKAAVTGGVIAGLVVLARRF